MNNIPTVTKNLLIINILAFFASWIFEQRGIDLNSVLGLHFLLASNFSPLQFLTYMFMHGSFAHLFFNMFALWMFGTVMERTWGTRRFLIYYLVCGIGAGVAQEVVQYVHYVSENMAAYSGAVIDAYLNLWTTVGASGAVYGILLAFGMTFPNERMFIIPFPFPIKAKWLVTGYIVIELYSALSAPGDGVAHMAHLGGMLFGYLLIRYWRKHQGGGSSFGSPADFINMVRNRQNRRKATTFHYQESVKREPSAEEQKRERERQEEIDAILDKIRLSGYDSLSKEEKKKLFDQSNRN